MFPRQGTIIFFTSWVIYAICPPILIILGRVAMDLGLKDKVAVVTASSQGLGRAVAEALAAEGARLALCSRDEKKIDATGASLKDKYGTDVLALPCDVGDKGSVEQFAGAVLKRFGAAHILFTNAGGPPSGGIRDFAPEDYETAVRLNLMSAIYLVYSFLPAMKEQRWGRIIASTSITVKQPLPTLVLSNVSRAGVVAFIRSLATEAGPHNITANAVAPGYIMTDRVQQILEARVRKEGVTFEAALQGMVSSIPAGRTGAPEEYGALVAFLASERAAFINGDTILIDGGMYRGLM